MEQFRKQFESKITKCGEHWIWTGKKCGEGQPRRFMFPDGKTMSVLRMAWILSGGLPSDGYIESKCGLIDCVNPDHLQPRRKRPVAPATQNRDRLEEGFRLLSQNEPDPQMETFKIAK